MISSFSHLYLVPTPKVRSTSSQRGLRTSLRRLITIDAPDTRFLFRSLVLSLNVPDTRFLFRSLINLNLFTTSQLIYHFFCTCSENKNCSRIEEMNGEYSGIYDCDEADPNWLYKVV